MTAPEVADVRPTPTDEEMAAIVAAIAMTWPQPVPVIDVMHRRQPVLMIAFRSRSFSYEFW